MLSPCSCSGPGSRVVGFPQYVHGTSSGNLSLKLRGNTLPAPGPPAAPFGKVFRGASCSGRNVVTGGLPKMIVGGKACARDSPLTPAGSRKAVVVILSMPSAEMDCE